MVGMEIGLLWALFNLEDNQYQLVKNNGINHLQWWYSMLHNVVWDSRPFKNNRNEDALELKYLSHDGEEGYPNLLVTVVYT